MAFSSVTGTVTVDQLRAWLETLGGDTPLHLIQYSVEQRRGLKEKRSADIFHSAEPEDKVVVVMQMTLEGSFYPSAIQRTPLDVTVKQPLQLPERKLLP